MQHSNSITVGILADWINSRYHFNLVEGIEAEAEGYNINRLYFIGTGLTLNDTYHKHNNIIYKLIDTGFLDYMIVYPGVIERATREETLEFFKQFKGIPIITLGFQLPDCPCVLLDNKSGIRAMLEHMIVKHKKTRIAFIRGPRNSFDSDERFDAYLEILAMHALPVDKRLIIDESLGGYDAGIEAAKILLEERGLVPGKDFDCLVAVNDAVAAGSSQYLTEHQVKIPQDLALCGFDDSERSRSNNPPITTVRQPNKDVSAAAIKYIIEKAGRTTATTVYLPTQMVIRDSCGCRFTLLKTASATTGETQEIKKAADWAVNKPQVIALLKQIMAAEMENAAFDGLIVEFADALTAFAGNRDTDQFLSFFMRILEYCTRTGLEIIPLYKALSMLKIWITDNLEHDSLTHALVLNLELASMEINIFSGKKDLNEQINYEAYMEKLRNFEENLRINLDFEQLFGVIARGLINLGFSGFYIFLYNDLQDFSHNF